MAMFRRWENNIRNFICLTRFPAGGCICAILTRCDGVKMSCRETDVRPMTAGEDARNAACGELEAEFMEKKEDAWNVCG